MRRVVFVVLAACLVAGCANYSLQRRQAALAPLVGQTEADLVRQLGVPTRVFETDGQRFLSYDEIRTDILPGFAPYYGSWWGPWGGWGGYGGFPPTVVQYGCQTTFDIAGGKVVSFSLRGNGC